MAHNRLGLLLALVPGLLHAQQPNATLVTPGTVPEVTLEEAIALANRVQPSVVQAQAAIRNAEAQKKVTVGNWLPNLNANSSAGYFYAEGTGRVDPNTGQFIGANTETQTVNLGLSTSWDVFTGFRRGNDSKAAKAGVTAAEASFANASYQQRFNTTIQFFTALAGREIVSVREQSVKRADEQLRAAVVRLHAGTATRSDSLRSVVTVGNTRVALSQAQADLIAAEAALARLIGYNGRVRAADDSAFYHPVAVIDTTVLLDEAMRRSPSVQSSAASLEQARAQYKASKSTYWPQLALGGSWTYNGNNANNFGLQNQRQASLSLNWAIFNRFTRERNVDLQLSNLQVAEANAADAEHQVQSLMLGQFAQLEAARLQIEISQQSLQASREDLRVVAERYRLGVATIVDLLVSQESLTQAELEVVNARFGYLQALAQIEAIVGRPL
ncbi:MAG: putative outer rane macrolide efflux protein [Gemmatimonadetes bacterium]|nr:putative outer rane macrolide efflux protein [Gemmatimonadota bacterium]